MKNLVSKISLVGLFLLPLPAFSSMADKFNAKKTCTKDTANYQRVEFGQWKDNYYCVEGNKVTWAWKPTLPNGTNQILEKVNGGIIGKMVQTEQGYLKEFAIEGKLLVKYSCKGWVSCSGPINKTVIAQQIR